MIGGGHGLENAEGVTKGTRKGSGELGSVIRNEFGRKTKAFPDMVTIQVGRTFRSDVGMTWGEDGHFGDIMIHKNSNGIKPLRRGKGYNEIHGSGRERSRILGRNDGEKGDGSTIGLVFCRLANRATVNIIEDKSTHSRPEELTANEVIGFISTGVTSSGGIMEGLDEITTKSVVLRDVDTTATK